MRNYFLLFHCLVWVWCACLYVCVLFACVGTNPRVCLRLMSGVIRDSFEPYSLRQSLSWAQASQMWPVCSGDSEPEWKAGWYTRLACMWFRWPELQSPQFNTEPKNWTISTAPAPPTTDCSRLNRFSALVTSVYLLRGRQRQQLSRYTANNDWNVYLRNPCVPGSGGTGL